MEGPGAPGVPWKRHIVRQLRQRDRTQKALFLELVPACECATGGLEDGSGGDGAPGAECCLAPRAVTRVQQCLLASKALALPDLRSVTPLPGQHSGASLSRFCLEPLPGRSSLLVLLPFSLLRGRPLPRLGFLGMASLASVGVLGSLCFFPFPCGPQGTTQVNSFGPCGPVKEFQSSWRF